MSDATVVWHGGSWRDVPPPAKRAPVLIECWHVPPSDRTLRERVEAQLDGEWRTAGSIAQYANGPANEVAVILLRLARWGLAERVQGTSRGGRRPFLYRRRTETR
jgi:hypothetical protein